MEPYSTSYPSRAWYDASIRQFASSDPRAVLGCLVSQSQFDSATAQVAAWEQQLTLLRDWLRDLDGHVFLEFSIPRMGRRIDAVVLRGPVVFVVEFKVGASEFEASGVDQVWDYALDLKNFHEASHGAVVIPMLVATGADRSVRTRVDMAEDGVATPLLVSAEDAKALLSSDHPLNTDSPIEAREWAAAPYRPTPTIIEAARVLYAQHSVASIARHDAGARNLTVTSRRIEELIDDARMRRRKIICFVTGVPGAGKTLVGLNVATQRRDRDQPTHAVFLSGNGPLVAVLREALTLDDLERRRSGGVKVSKARAANPVKAFIQNVHHFRDEALVSLEPPSDRVVIFDEAQRAWNLQKTANFMKQRKKREGFSRSEPSFLMSYMDRHEDWAVIVCLVGGGQEIHTGEAGISEWLNACAGEFRHWHVFISENLRDSEYAAGHALERLKDREHSILDAALHLYVSMRSFRAENLSTFVKSLLDLEESAARVAFAELRDRYPIFLTRDLGRAKHWIRSRARGTERSGLVASSKAMRLKPHAIDIRVAIDPVHYFLKDRNDTRSSDFLEDCATEFQVQGLELDWACVNWDGDLRYTDRGWSFHDFRGSRWESIHQAERQAYLRNAYRVLLTRARQGMVLFIPPGDADDPTRPSGFYDPTFNYLRRLGIPILD